MTVGLQKGIQRFGIAPKTFAILFKAKIFDILVGVVQHCMEMAAQVGQIVVNGRELLLQLAAHLPRGVGGGVGGIRFDQVDDGFRLGQIHFSVEKGALGKFSPLGGKRPGEIQSLQPCRQHGRGTVAVKFHRVLAGVGVGRAGDHRHALVNDPVLLVVQGSENQTAVGGVPQGLSAVQCKYLIRDRDAPVTRQADDADGGNGSAGGYGGTHVGHKKPPDLILRSEIGHPAYRSIRSAFLRTVHAKAVMFIKTDGRVVVFQHPECDRGAAVKAAQRGIHELPTKPQTLGFFQ